MAMRRRYDVAYSDEIPSNKPLEWTGHRQVVFDSDSFLPATQGQRSKDVSCLMGASKAALRGRSHEAKVS
jgi:hypothetical protein